MLKKYSCRKVAVFGALLLFSGSLLTSMAVTMSYFIISFGVVFGNDIITHNLLSTQTCLSSAVDDVLIAHAPTPLFSYFADALK